MSFGPREIEPFPETYRGFHLVRTHGRVFCIPPTLDPEEIRYTGTLLTHPAIMCVGTLEEAQELIDGFDERVLQPEVLAQYKGYNLVRFRGTHYAVPLAAGNVDLDVSTERSRAGVLSGTSIAELHEAIRRAEQSVPVEFAGWLPIYKFSGNCGTHPQFTHTGEPPPGYRFTCSSPPEERRQSWWSKVRGYIDAPIHKVKSGLSRLIRPLSGIFRPQRGVSVRSRLRVIGAMNRLFVNVLRAGCNPLAALRFLQSRHLQSQLLIGDERKLMFLTSMPYTYGQNPWVIEIEDPTTLFYPLIQNGRTSGMSLRGSQYFPAVKALLEGEHCQAILTHMKSTEKLVASLFESDIIRGKLIYSPLGVKLPARWQHHEPRRDDEPIHLLFINSWCQVPENFYVRGGLDILEAFATLHERYPQLRLTMRTNLPFLADHYHRIIEQGWVRVINRFVTTEEMAELHASSHIYLLPAARVHIVSLLQAMSYGLGVVASDGWGMEEYVTHERNGLVVRGRYGKVSWADEDAGMLRENYEPMYTSDPDVVAGIVEAVSRLVEDQALLRRLGRTARQDVQTTFNLERWNQGLKAALDRADLGVSASDAQQPPRQKRVAV